MRFRETPLAGAFVVEIEAHADARGFFARTWCSREFAAHGLDPELVQASISRSALRGTVRGMHLQLPPSREAKLVRCTRGVIYDVIIDLRPSSPAYLRHFAIELSAQSCNALYVPAQLAHGFQTLEDDSEVLYQMSDFYAPELGFGLRWNDPAFGIQWPERDRITILPRDGQYQDFNAGRFETLLRSASASAPSQPQPGDAEP